MGIRIEAVCDVQHIKNVAHRAFIKERHMTVDSMLRNDTQLALSKMGIVATNERITESIGCSIYIEEADNLFSSSVELNFDDTGIYHAFWNNTPSWEAVDKVDDLYVITWLANNEAGYVYFLPEEIAKKYPELMGWLSKNLIKEDLEANEDHKVPSEDRWPDNKASADN